VSDSRPSQAGGASESVWDGRQRSSIPNGQSWRREDFAPPPAEALAAPAIVYALHQEIDGDPFNIRESLPAVDRLAWSIYQHGLLENLIVVEIPLAERKNGKRFELRAGSRRFEAIRRLIEGMQAPLGHPDRESGVLWVWPADKPVPVLVLGSGGHYEHLIENVERSPPEPWEIGRRLSEILSAGVTTRELGVKVGRSNGWITRYAQIGRGLAPELITLLRQERAEPHIGELCQLAALRDRFGDPDAEAQISAYRDHRKKRRKRPRRIDPHGLRATMKRLQYLRADMVVPAVLRPIVSAIIDYLEGGKPPGFRELETAIFEKVRVLSPHIEEDA
jgi:ParB-like chromosome segregation protein Spo0J